MPVNPVRSTLLKDPVRSTISVAAGLNTNPVVPLVATVYPADWASVNPVTIVLVPVAPAYVQLMYTVPVVV